MAKILVCYYSRTGHTENMAKLIGQGAAGVEGSEVDVRSVADVSADDLINYDAILMGSPTYYGTMSWEMKKLLDESVRFHGQLSGKVGGAFSSAANIGGGNETTVMDLVKALLIHGMVVQGVVKGDHYGPVAINDVDERSSKQCIEFGKLMADLTVRLHG